MGLVDVYLVSFMRAVGLGVCMDGLDLLDVFEEAWCEDFEGVGADLRVLVSDFRKG